MIRAILLQLYRIWAVGTFGIFMLVLTPMIVLSFVFGEKWGGKLAYKFLNFWAIGWATIAAIRYEIKGLENISPYQSYIFAANHNSFLDSPALVWAIPNDFRPLGKIEMSRVPIFGLMYRYVVIMIDRSNGRSRLASLVEMKRRLDGGTSILIFPEGTMNKTPEKTNLQPFQDGAFRLAIETQTPIAPIVVENSGKLLHPLEGLRVRRGTIKMTFLPPISTTNLDKKDTVVLKQQVYDLMKNYLDKK